MDISRKQNSSHAILFEKPRNGDLTLKNRIALAPMTRTSATEDGLANEEMGRYYARFAQGCGAEDARIIFESLAKAAPDFIHITEYDATRPAFYDGETLTELAKRYVNVSVIANGQLGEPAKAEALIERGQADVITLGKSALPNPSWPKRVMEGEPIEDFYFSILQPQAYIKVHEL